jgi:hypothetical protein
MIKFYHPFTLFMIGSPREGKTHCAKNIVCDLFNRKEIDYCYIFTGNKAEWQFIYNDDYKFDMIKPCLFSNKKKKGVAKKVRTYSCVLRKIYKNQRAIWQNGFMMMNGIIDPVDMHRRKNSPKAKCLILIDDNTNLLKEGCAYRILQRYRHISTSIIIISQSVTKLDPNARTMFDNIITFRAKMYNDLNNIAGLICGEKNAKLAEQLMSKYIDGKPKFSFLYYCRSKELFITARADEKINVKKITWNSY